MNLDGLKISEHETQLKHLTDMNEQEKIDAWNKYASDNEFDLVLQQLSRGDTFIAGLSHRDAEVSALREKIKAISELSDQLLDNASDPGYDDGQQAAYRHASELIHATLTK